MQNAGTTENGGIPTVSYTDDIIYYHRNKVEHLDYPVKSENDRKDYRIIRLENGLTVAIISDTSGYEQPAPKENINISSVENGAFKAEELAENSTEKSSGDVDMLQSFVKQAAASLTVGVGSLNDPLEYQGLSHFLEHMVFMGSKRYPQENDFDAFIKKGGGFNNAFTEWESTTFYFETRQDYLANSLDRFAHFFVEPLMKQESIAREREAVESEFQMSIAIDSARNLQLICSLAEEGHPISNFSWGNIQTLSPKDGSPEGDVLIREQLFMFLRRHYSAHRMTLAIQGQMSLDELQEMVCRSFSQVPNNSLPSDLISSEGAWSSPFPKEKFHRLYKVKAIGDICMVELRWIFPPKKHLYKTKPIAYLSFLVQHEGKGSLLSYLHERVWALSISASSGLDNFENNALLSQFVVRISLTESGLENIDQVVAAVFGYIDMLKEEGPSERVYNELKRIGESTFRYLEEISAVGNVMRYSKNLQDYPPKDMISGAALVHKFNPQDILGVLDHLRRDTVNIMIFSKDILDANDQLLAEKWFGTQYSVEDIPTSWLSTKSQAAFHLPVENKFLTSNFELLPVPEGMSSPYPTCMRRNTFFELWMKQDLKFRLPHMFCNLYLMSPASAPSPLTSSMLDLFLCILNHQLAEELFAAKTCGLSYSITPGNRGILLKVRGFDEKLPVLLEIILEHMVNFRENLKENEFQAWKKKQEQTYYNHFLKPRNLVQDIHESLILQTKWSNFDKYSAITQVTSDHLVEFVENMLLKHLYVKCLIQGNVSKEKALYIGNKILNLLDYKPLFPRTYPQIRVCQVPLGESYCRVKSFSNDDNNSSLINYYQIGCEDLKTSCIAQVLMMMMEEPLFDELRTKQQLGYSVSCSHHDSNGIISFRVNISTQANKHNMSDVELKVEEFVQGFLQYVMTPEGASDLKIICEALIKVKQAVDNQLQEEVSRNWNQIASSNYMFDIRQQEVKCLQELTIKDINKFIKRYTSSTKKKNLRKLSVQVVGMAEVKQDESSKQFGDSELAMNEETTSKPFDGKTMTGIVNSDKKVSCHEYNQICFLGGRKMHQSPEMDGEMSDMLTEHYGCKYREKKDPKGEAVEDRFIMDIEAFKSGLYIYPLKKMAAVMIPSGSLQKTPMEN